MKNNHYFEINFSSLGLGNHRFEFVVDDKFFELFEESEIKHAKVKVDVDFLKQAGMFVLLFFLNGKVEVMCDRCLENFNQQIESQYKLIIKLGQEEKEETDEIVFISESLSKINIAQYIYEYIHLSLPIQKIHPNDENGNSLCDNDLIEKLNLYSEENNQKSGDLRWEVLKNLKIKN